MEQLLKTNVQSLNLSNQQLTSLMQLYKGLPLVCYLQNMQNLQQINLSSNKI